MKTQRQEGQPILRLLTPEQARTLMATAKGHPCEILLTLALVLGLRASELLALQWQAIDGQNASLAVHSARQASRGCTSQSPFHPAKHPRIVPLPQGVITRLQEHATRQQQQRERAGARWQPYDLVICTRHGTPLPASHLTPLVQDLLLQAQLPALRFQELRSTTAHLLLLSGMAPPIIRAILGMGGQVLAGCEHLAPVSLAYYEQARQMMEPLFFTA